MKLNKKDEKWAIIFEEADGHPAKVREITMRLASLIERCKLEKPPALDIDMNPLHHVNSEFIALLVNAHNTLDGKVRLLSVQKEVKDLFAIIQIDQLLTIVDA